MADSAMTAADLARILSLSRSRLTQLKSEGLPFTATAGGDRFNLRAAVSWYCSHTRLRNGGNGSNGAGVVSSGLSVDQARARKMEADAKMSELRYGLEVRQVMRTEDAMRIVAAHVTGARARLLAMGPKLGAVLAVTDAPHACQALIDAEVRDALEELSMSAFDAPAPMAEEASQSVQ